MRTPTTHLRALTLCATLAVLAVAGCTDPDPAATPTPTDTWTKPWYPEDETEAIAEAEQAVRDYWQAWGQCLADPPSSDPSCFEQVSYGDLLTANQTTLKDARDQGYRYGRN